MPRTPNPLSTLRTEEAKLRKQLADNKARQKQEAAKATRTRQMLLGLLADQCGHSAIPLPTLEKLYRKLMDDWQAQQSPLALEEESGAALP
jgi:hypothetical protein